MKQHEVVWSSLQILALFAFWSVVGLVFSVSWMLSSAAEGTPISWRSAATWDFLIYYLWFLFSPVVITLARKFPLLGERQLRNTVIHCCCGLLLAAIHVAIFLPLNKLLDPHFNARFASLGVAFHRLWPYRLITGFVTYGFVAFAFAARQYYRGQGLAEHRAAELQLQLVNAQLQTLRTQIHPHFLFNTLHSISALIYESPADAYLMVSRLGSYLRATLERSAPQTICLQEELRLAELYLDIEKVRFGDRLRVTIQVPQELLGTEIPSLILQPLLENAIRHGIGRSIDAVQLEIRASRQGKWMELTLSNSALTCDSSLPSRNAREGLGLANTRARLSHLYGSAAKLSSETPTPGSFRVRLGIPLSAAAA